MIFGFGKGLSQFCENCGFYLSSHRIYTIKNNSMKRQKLAKVIMLAVMTCPFIAANAQNAPKEEYAEITFQETTHNFGLFDVEHGNQSCYFVFTNTGNKELLILSATASCGCTVPTYPKTAILPGEKDSIKVEYNGTSKRPGVFKKSINLVTNAKLETCYLYIMGEMVEKLVEDRVAKPVGEKQAEAKPVEATSSVVK